MAPAGGIRAPSGTCSSLIFFLPHHQQTYISNSYGNSRNTVLGEPHTYIFFIPTHNIF